MTILITGATGKVGQALVRHLEAANLPQLLLLATRSGTSDGPHKAVKFDWFDQSTYAAPFAAADVDKVFLIQPEVWDPLTYIKPFVELGIGKGAKRFVYVSSSTLEKGSMVNGKVHEYLADRGVDYCVLRPTTLTENFSTIFRNGILNGDAIMSASAGGKAAFVSVEDVAKVACDALTAEKSPNRDFLIVGPDLYSFDEVADLLTETLGRKILHNCVSQDEYEGILQKFGMEARYAAMLGYIQSKYADGSEAAITKDPEVITGTHRLVDYLQANKSLWTKS